jgi:hypothetical protein
VNPEAWLVSFTNRDIAKPLLQSGAIAFRSAHLAGQEGAGSEQSDAVREIKKKGSK